MDIEELFEKLDIKLTMNSESYSGETKIIRTRVQLLWEDKIIAEDWDSVTL